MDLLKNAAECIGIDISDAQIKNFLMYEQILLNWNKKINLTAITDSNEIILKHFIDSMTVLSVINEESIKAVDVGTGAGFPGVPVKIMRPGIDMTLMDSLNKRIKFIEYLTGSLELNGIQSVHIRAEDAGRGIYRESFELCLSRAVSNLSALAEYCLPLIKTGGKFISMKGPDVKAEVLAAKAAIYELGGEISEIKPVKIPFTDITHSLIIISKLHQTPSKYPRKSVKISKAPII